MDKLKKVWFLIMVGIVLVGARANTQFHNVYDDNTWDWYSFTINITNEVGMELDQSDVRFQEIGGSTEFWQYRIDYSSGNWALWEVNVTNIVMNINRTIEMEWNSGNTTLKSDIYKTRTEVRDAETAGSFTDDWFCTEFSSSAYDCSAFSIASDQAYSGTKSYKMTDPDNTDNGGYLWINETNNTVNPSHWKIEAYYRVSETTPNYGGLTWRPFGNLRYSTLLTGGLQDWTWSWFRYIDYPNTPPGYYYIGTKDSLGTATSYTDRNVTGYENKWYKQTLVRSGNLTYSELINTSDNWYYRINHTANVPTAKWSISGMILKGDGLEQGAVWLDDWSVRPYSVDEAVYLDVVPIPTVTIFNPIGNYSVDYVSLDYTTGMAVNPIDDCWYNVDDGSNTTIVGCANTSITSLSEGDHTVYLWVNDTGGAEGLDTSTFTIDLTNPEVTIVEPVNQTYDSVSVPLNFVVSDNVTGVWYCQYSINGGSFTNISGCANTTTIGVIGSNNLILKAFDFVGNENQDYVSFIVDSRAYVWINDTSTGFFLDNFGLTLSNGTQTSNLNTSGYYINFSILDTPTGTVSFLITKEGYNHTAENLIINASAFDQNYTLQVSPAIIMVYRVTRVDYSNIKNLPVEVTISNLTSTKTYTPSMEIFDSYVCNACGTDSIISNVGTIWYYSIYVNTWPAYITTDYVDICDVNGQNCVNVATYGGSPQHREGYLIIKESGTWEIRDATSFGLVSSGSYGLYPSRMKIRSVAGLSEIVTVNGYELSIPQAECYYAATCPTGNVTVSIDQSTNDIYGYLGEVYLSSKFAFTTVDSSFKYNFTSYMVKNTNGKSVKFTVTDNQQNAIEHALITVFEYLDGEYKIWASDFTDGTGITTFNMQTVGNYVVIISADGYRSKSVNINNPQNEYTVLLSLNVGQFESPLDGISWSLEPFETAIRQGDVLEVVGTVLDSQNDIEQFGLSLVSNETAIVNLTSVAPTGGILAYNYTTTANDNSIIVRLYFNRVDGSQYYLQKTYSVWDYSENVTTLTSVASDFVASVGVKALSILVLIASFFLATIHPLFAVAGLFIFLLMNFVSLVVPVAVVLALIGVALSLRVI